MIFQRVDAWSKRVDVFAETFLVLMKLIVRPCLAIHNRRTTFQMVYAAL